MHYHSLNSYPAKLRKILLMAELAKISGIFCKIKQDDYFIIQHIDNKAQLHCRKAGQEMIFTLPFFFPNSQNYVYRTTDGRRIVSA